MPLAATAHDLLLRGTPFTPGGVRRVAVPAAARTLSTLPRADYEDAFLVETGPTHDRTAEQWARVILEDPPVIVRRALSWAWFSLGLKLGSTRSEQLVLGWEVRRSTPDFALLGDAGSRLGLEAEVLLQRQQHTLLCTTFVRQQNPVARAVWAGSAPGHRRAVRYLLEQVSRRTREQAKVHE